MDLRTVEERRQNQSIVSMLSVVGLGKLGACTAACFASKGYQVLGYDINKSVVDKLSNGQAPVVEPGLQELITSHRKNIRATLDIAQLITETDATFLITPTPSEPDGSFSNKFLESALESLAKTLRSSSKSDHLFVITSTVSPGAIDKKLIPFIEQHSERRHMKGFRVAYNPEFIALGSVIKDFLSPDLILIGEDCKVTGDQLEELYKKTCVSRPHVARMSIISAEIAKISLNAYITMKISFANTLASICDSIPGADVDAITQALGADKRISPFYLKGGLPFGGPCFPRDNRALSAFAAEYGVDPKLAVATDQVNNMQIKRIIDKISKYSVNQGTNSVSIIGLAYKPNTPVVEESPAIRIIQELLKKGAADIWVYDPLAMEETKRMLGNRINYAKDLKECVSKSAVCVVTTSDSEYKDIDDSCIAHNPFTLIDCWRIIDKTKFK
ncbi:MAG: UDP-glucose/GDP-mannose dehydrogenase family protein, partial [Planctomycetes bacterium]|nr:UDP-glucose/GDP-mannose dehydrogenase family protein [Planctomycetota bacterium]